MKKKFQTTLVTLILTATILINHSAIVLAHTYYNDHISNEQAEQADTIAKAIAEKILSNKSYTTDLQRVSAAVDIVASYARKCIYGADENKYYRTPYGVFISGNFTCAGTTRALGRVLDFMGYEYTHVNENEWLHQWNVLYMDGQIGYADGQGAVGYGEYKWGIATVKAAQQNRKSFK